MSANYYSQQGTRTNDNRDAHLVIERDEVSLYMVIDGCTSCPTGGQLARALADGIEQGFNLLPSEDLQPKQIKASILELLEKTRKSLQKPFVTDSASFLILLRIGPVGLVIHAGDCCLGRIKRTGRIDWLTPLHTLASALKPIGVPALRLLENRHILTRCFKPRRRSNPDWRVIGIHSCASMILATDGFWADLTELQQQQLLTGKTLMGPCDDDTTFILIPPLSPP